MIVAENSATCEISEAELRDLQTTVQINKDIIKSLIEAQQVQSPNHGALKQTLQKLNEENRILQKRINGGEKGTYGGGIIVMEKSDKEAVEKSQVEK